MQKAWIVGLLACMSFVGFSCQKELKDPDEEQKYKGPTLENHDVITLYSDSARLLIKLQAPVQQEFESGDGVFPEGLYVEFFEKPGQVTSTLRANYGKQNRSENLFLARGNVVVKNLVKQETLETEELFWDRSKAEIYTDKFVKITTAEEVLMGKGLRANQDFSWYKITNPTGTFDLKE
ncbi:LPS export ABC transporter protein LptC [Pontibacter ummariensis]|uniref:LPS export ABC transporter protein LptC n=1 Tax=Pontibacter ummariensis TaxID=1610492 RepID=A0A239CFE0_9BACT|nr:LPS export ABC transporter periplasmic protein LptC [Pontibacter ummariensis]PRY15041.1 LPS export ABC transporter protein LptC [Pontibacter ummariensis]SNS18945.1 LPS export ABC transporter protein LptC [Pontibacter ummariensis]